MLAQACPSSLSASRLTVSIENVDMVVNAPKKPVKMRVFSGPSASTPHLNMRKDARQHPTMLTMNVAHGNSVSTAL